MLWENWCCSLLGLTCTVKRLSNEPRPRQFVGFLDKGDSESKNNYLLMWCWQQHVTKSVLICLYIVTFLNSWQISAFHMWEVVLVVTLWCKVFVALQFIWVGNKLCENLFSVLGFSIFQEFDKIDSSSFIVYSCFPFLLTSLEKKIA